MQARFLKKVVSEFQSLKTRSRAAPETNRNSLQQLAAIAMTDSQANNQHIGNLEENHNDFQDSQSLTESQADFGTDLFANKDLWENLFSDAGFGTRESIFPGSVLYE